MGGPEVNDVVLLTVDPGKCTGYLLDNVPGAAPVIDQLPALDFCELAEREARVHQGALTIVYEKFTITQATLRKAREAHAIEVIGVLKFLSYTHGCRLIEQTPGDAKRFATDARLKKLHLWVPGKDHARDAARHAVLWGVRSGFINPEDL